MKGEMYSEFCILNYKFFISLSICFLMSFSLRICFFSIFLINFATPIFSLINQFLFTKISRGMMVVHDLSNAADIFANSFLVINNFLLPLGWYHGTSACDVFSYNGMSILSIRSSLSSNLMNASLILTWLPLIDFTSCHFKIIPTSYSLSTW